MIIKNDDFTTYKISCNYIPKSTNPNEFVAEKTWTGTICVRADGYMLGIAKDKDAENPAHLIYGSYSYLTGMQFAKFNYVKHKRMVDEYFAYNMPDIDGFLGNFLLHTRKIIEINADCHISIEPTSLSLEKEEELLKLINKGCYIAGLYLNPAIHETYMDEKRNHMLALHLLELNRQVLLNSSEYKNNFYYTEGNKIKK